MSETLVKKHCPKCKVVWIRHKKEFRDKEFNFIKDAIEYICKKLNKDITDLRLTSVSMPNYGRELIFDYYGRILVCIIQVEDNKK